MSIGDREFDRRSVLKATGAALGTAVAGTGTAAAGHLCLKYDWQVYTNCPPTGDPDGPIVSAGTQAYEGCTGYDGTQYYYVIDENGAGYVTRNALEPC